MSKLPRSMQKKTPKVTVLATVYNEEPFLAEAIESILTQTFGDFEFLLIDDGSSDSSPQIMRDYAKKDKRIRVLTLPDNRGTPYASNIGLKAARTPLIARMDGDDISLPERLQKQYDYMEKHPEVGLVSTQWYGFSVDKETGEKIITLRPEIMNLDDKAEMRLAYLCDINLAGHGQSMFRRDLVLDIGSYREFFRYGAADTDINSRLWEKAEIAVLPDTLYWWRHNSSTSLFIANYPTMVALGMVSRVCSLYRRAGRGDPITTVKDFADLPAYFGLPKSVTLKDLQIQPHWAMRALRKHLSQYPIEPRAKRALYGLMTKHYQNRKFFPGKKFHWARYFMFVLERELLFSSLLHGRER